MNTDALKQIGRCYAGETLIKVAEAPGQIISRYTAGPHAWARYDGLHILVELGLIELSSENRTGNMLFVHPTERGEKAAKLLAELAEILGAE